MNTNVDLADTISGNQERSPQGVQSAETVLEVLSAFVGAEPTLMLRTIADRCGMHPAKVHRYLVSLCRAGFVEQDLATSKYRLGGTALRLGYATKNCIDVVRVARPMMESFCEKVQQAMVLAVWNTNGPTIALKESLPGLLVLSVHEGFRSPVIRSSVGSVFGAWKPRAETAALIAEELEQTRVDSSLLGPKTESQVETMFAAIRERGLARTTGQFSPGTHSFSAPIFDVSGQIVAALCALGPVDQFDSSWESPIASGLRECADALSRSLGYISGDDKY